MLVIQSYILVLDSLIHMGYVKIIMSHPVKDV